MDNNELDELYRNSPTYVQECFDRARSVLSKIDSESMKIAYKSSVMAYCMGSETNPVTNTNFPKYVILSSSPGPLKITDSEHDLIEKQTKIFLKETANQLQNAVDSSITNPQTFLSSVSNISNNTILFNTLSFLAGYFVAPAVDALSRYFPATSAICSGFCPRAVTALAIPITAFIPLIYNIINNMSNDSWALFSKPMSLVSGLFINKTADRAEELVDYYLFNGEKIDPKEYYGYFLDGNFAVGTQTTILNRFGDNLDDLLIHLTHPKDANLNIITYSFDTKRFFLNDDAFSQLLTGLFLLKSKFEGMLLKFSQDDKYLLTHGMLSPIFELVSRLKAQESNNKLKALSFDGFHNKGYNTNSILKELRDLASADSYFDANYNKVNKRPIDKLFEIVKSVLASEKAKGDNLDKLNAIKSEIVIECEELFQLLTEEDNIVRCSQLDKNASPFSNLLITLYQTSMVRPKTEERIEYWLDTIYEEYPYEVIISDYPKSIEICQQAIKELATAKSLADALSNNYKKAFGTAKRAAGEEFKAAAIKKAISYFNDVNSINPYVPYPRKPIGLFSDFTKIFNGLTITAMNKLSEELNNLLIEKNIEAPFIELMQINKRLSSQNYPFLKQTKLRKLKMLQDEIKNLIKTPADEYKYSSKLFYINLLSQTLLAANAEITAVDAKTGYVDFNIALGSSLVEFFNLANIGAFTQSEILKFSLTFAMHFINVNAHDHLNILISRLDKLKFSNLSPSDQFTHDLFKSIVFAKSNKIAAQLALQDKMDVAHASSLTEIAEHYFYYQGALASQLSSSTDDQTVLKIAETAYLAALKLYEANAFYDNKFKDALLNSIYIYGQVASQDPSYKQQLYAVIDLAIASYGANKWLFSKTALSNEAISYVANYVQKLDSKQYPMLPKKVSDIEEIFNGDNEQGANDIIISVLKHNLFMEDYDQVFVYLSILNDLYPDLPCRTLGYLNHSLAKLFSKYSAHSPELGTTVLHFVNQMPSLSSCEEARSYYINDRVLEEFITGLKCNIYKVISLWEDQDIITNEGIKPFFEGAIKELDSNCDSPLHKSIEVSVTGE